MGDARSAGVPGDSFVAADVPVGRGWRDRMTAETELGRYTLVGTATRRSKPAAGSRDRW